MRHMAFALAVLLTPFLAYANEEKTPVEAIQTPFGEVALKSEETPSPRYLTFRGQVIPNLEANSFLALGESFSLKDGSVAILVFNFGGTGCPLEEIYWLTIGKNGYKLSPSFGTCSDLYKVELKGDKLVATVQDWERSRIRHVFTYDGRQITTRTYQAKSPWLRPKD